MHSYSKSSNYIRNILEKNLYRNNYLNLSGWNNVDLGLTLNTDLNIHLENKYLTTYSYDEENYLEEKKMSLAKHLTEREKYNILQNQFMITQGATSALTLILHYLVGKIDILIIDTPFYFSIIEVCKALNIYYEIPLKTIESIDNDLPLIQLLKKYKYKRKGLLLTQPKYIISKSHKKDFLQYLYTSYITEKDFFILDQSLDLLYINNDNFINLSRKNFIKIRTIGKNISMFGSRLAMIISHEECLADIFIYSDFLYGAVDIGMLELGLALVKDNNKYRVILESQNKLILEKAKNVVSKTIDSNIDFFYGNAGYLSYMKVNLKKKKRYDLYKLCMKENIHSIFSSQFGLNQSFNSEGIRVNLLLDVNESIDKIIDFFH